MRLRFCNIQNGKQARSLSRAENQKENAGWPWLCDEPINSYEEDDAHNRSIDQFVVSGQPVWQVNVKVIFC